MSFSAADPVHPKHAWLMQLGVTVLPKTAPSQDGDTTTTSDPPAAAGGTDPGTAAADPPAAAGGTDPGTTTAADPPAAAGGTDPGTAAADPPAATGGTDPGTTTAADPPAAGTTDPVASAGGNDGSAPQGDPPRVLDRLTRDGDPAGTGGGTTDGSSLLQRRPSGEGPSTAETGGAGTGDAATAGVSGSANVGTAVAGSADGAVAGGTFATMNGAPVGVRNDFGSPPPPPASYVANPNTPAGLQGGPNASAGDSAFVAGGYPSALKSRADSMRSAASAIISAEAALEAEGKNKDSFLKSVRNMKTIADSLLKLAREIDKWSGERQSENIAKGDAIMEKAGKLLEIAEAVEKIQGMNGKLDAFKKKPGPDTARAWAKGVGQIFNDAAALVPSDGLPGFIPAMWKGLLSAPAAYIDAFLTMMDMHYDKIDDAAGITRETSSGNSEKPFFGKRKGWRGDLTPIYMAGFALPKAQGNRDFLDFMVDHVTSEGPDLWTVKMSVGKAFLLAAVGRELADDDPAKEAWIGHINKY